MPFTISTPSLYYIGYLDMIPDGIGYHVKNEMGGIWQHPMRIVRNLWFRRNGKILRALGCTLTPWSYDATFDSFKTVMLFPKEGTLMIQVTETTDPDTELMLNIAPESAWLTPVKPRVFVRRDTIVTKLEYNNITTAAKILSTQRFVPAGQNEVVTHVGTGITLNIDINRAFGMNHSGDGKSFYKDRLAMNRLICGKSATQDEYNLARSNLLQLISCSPYTGVGITGGHPDFPWFFGIDTLLSVRGMILAGFHKEAKESLRMLLKYSVYGRIPHEIITNGTIYNLGDLEESAIFPWMFLEYLRWSGDKEFAMEARDKFWQTITYVAGTGMKGRGIMEDSEAGSGIDVDTVSFFVRSLTEVLNSDYGLFDVPGSLDPDYLNEIRTSLTRIVKRSFWVREKRSFANRIVDGIPITNKFWTSTIPFYTGIASWRQYQDFISSDGGLQEISINGEILVNTAGSTMPMNTGLMSMAAANYGDIATALRYFKSLEKSLGSFSPLSFPEIRNDNTGCYLQAWSASMFIEVLLIGLLGVSVSEEKLSWKPSGYREVFGRNIKLENFRYKDQHMTLNYSRKSSKDF